MGEVLAQLRFAFNRSIRVEARPEHLTADPGALVVREIEERLGLCRWLGKRISDPRDPDAITHPMTELLRTAIVLPACGYQDQDDADSLRDDPVMRLAVSDRRGTSPLQERTAEERAVSRNPDEPDGLASQPTLSRLERTLSEEGNLKLLHRSLSWMTSRRVRRLRRGQRMRYATLDVDSLPIDVVGQQPGSAYNEHFHGRVYHPLVASLAETADLLAVRLREGHVHTANGALDFVLPLLDYVETEICQVAAVRIDAGFPDEPFLGGLEQRGTPYAARVKNNAVLDRLAEPYLHRPVGRPPSEPRTWCYEETYQAKSWSRPRRVVLVVLERPGELLLDWFWLVTNWSAEQQPATALLDFYRQRGTAEGHFGELKDVLDPLLSSSPRPKSHYRQQALARTYPSGNSFLLNEVRLLLNAIAYNLMNLARNLIEASTGKGWSLRRLRERVLRGGARLVVHGRRAVLVISRSGARFWGPLASQLGSIGPPPPLRAL